MPEKKTTSIAEIAHALDKLGTVTALAMDIYKKIIVGLMVIVALAVIVIGMFVYMMLNHLHDSYKGENIFGIEAISAAYLGRNVRANNKVISTSRCIFRTNIV